MEEFEVQNEEVTTAKEAGGTTEQQEEPCEACGGAAEAGGEPEGACGNSEEAGEEPETCEASKEAGGEPKKCDEQLKARGNSEEAGEEPETCEASKEAAEQSEEACEEQEKVGEQPEEACEEPKTAGEGSEEICEEQEAACRNAEEAEAARAFRGASMEKLDELLKQMTETREAVNGQLEALDKLFKARIMHTDHEEKVIDQMHRELQKYKEDLYAQLIRPVLLDVIEVREDMCKVIEGIRERPAEEQKVPLSELEIYEQYLQDILEKNNVVLHRSEPGNAFVPIRQRIVKKVPTEDESLHGKVCKSLSDGYEYGGRTISAEKVAAYVYVK